MHRLVLQLGWLLLPALLAARPAGEDIQPAGVPGLLENRGQMVDASGEPRPDVLFSAATQAGQVFVTPTGLHYQFFRPADASAARADRTRGRAVARLDVQLVGANPAAEVVKQAPTGYHANYYLAHCPKGITQVRSYERIRFKNIYPGIDWVLQRKGQALKYTFEVAPGADPAQIRFAVAGADTIRTTAGGDLRMTTPLGSVREAAPVCWQGRRDSQRVEAQFCLTERGFGFQLSGYDPRRPLTIDPHLVWSTYVGGGIKERGYSVDLNSKGQILQAGYTNSPSNLLATQGTHQTFVKGSHDAYVVKFDSTGQRIWGTYIGGNKFDEGLGMAVGRGDQIYLGGETFSDQAIATPGGHQPQRAGFREGFLVRLNDQGQRVWGTYVGGPQKDVVRGVATDTLGNVYITGTTESPSGIAEGIFSDQDQLLGGKDAFLARYNTQGGHVWSTYFGGPGQERGYELASGPNGRIAITGETDANQGIATPSAHQTDYQDLLDAYLAVFTRLGQKVWSTYYGGKRQDRGHAVAVAPDSSVYLGGWTRSRQNIATIPAHQSSPNNAGDAFLVRFAANGTRQWGTYLGGQRDDGVYALELDPHGRLYVGGGSASKQGIATSDGTYSVPSKKYSAYLAQFTVSGERLWATYLGGDQVDRGDHLAVDARGNVYLSGQTYSSQRVAKGNVFQPQPGSANNIGGDAYLARFWFCYPTDSSFSIDRCYSYTSPSGRYTWINAGTYHDTIRNHMGCDSILTIDLRIQSPARDTLRAFACEQYTSPSGNYVWDSSGRYWDTLATPGACDSLVQVQLHVGPRFDTLDTSVCGGLTAPSGAPRWTRSGHYTDTLTTVAGCDSIVTLRLTVDPIERHVQTVRSCSAYRWRGRRLTQSGRYADTLTSRRGCDSIRALALRLHERPSASFRIAPDSLYLPEQPALTATYTGSASAVRWQWQAGTGQAGSGATFGPVRFDEPGDYPLQLIAETPQGCRDTARRTVSVGTAERLYMPTAFSPDGNGRNEVFAPQGVGYRRYHLRIYSRWGAQLHESRGANVRWRAGGVPEGTYIYAITAYPYDDGPPITRRGTVTVLR